MLRYYKVVNGKAAPIGMLTRNKGIQRIPPYGTRYLHLRHRRAGWVRRYEKLKILTITDATLLSITGTPPGGKVATAYTAFTFFVAGGEGAKTYAAPVALPPGLALNASTGAISGTPTTAGTYPGLAVVVTDSSGSARVDFSMTIIP